MKAKIYKLNFKYKETHFQSKSILWNFYLKNILKVRHRGGGEMVWEDFTALNKWPILKP